MCSQHTDQLKSYLWNPTSNLRMDKLLGGWWKNNLSSGKPPPHSQRGERLSSGAQQENCVPRAKFQTAYTYVVTVEKEQSSRHLGPGLTLRGRSGWWQKLAWCSQLGPGDLLLHTILQNHIRQAHSD